MSASRDFVSTTGGKVNAMQLSGRWTITAYDQGGQVVDTLHDRETPTQVRDVPSDDAIRIFLQNAGMVDLMSEVKLFIRDANLRFIHGTGY